MFADCQIISRVTRADLIADGDLIDVSETAREAGFKLPVAITSAAWESSIAWTDEDNRRKRTCNDEAGRLWDVLWMAGRAALRTGTGTDQSTRLFSFYRVPREGTGHKPRLHTLKMICGPGDTREPVITILETDED